jgi:broad specificity phosphatase PhoE
MIILVRHAQSEGNKNRDIHQTTPDHRVKLTPEGHRQAQEAGRRLRDLLRPDDTLHFFTSPYRRTRETAEGMLNSLTSDSPSPSPFPRHTIKVYEEPRLREQDFGNFQPCSTEMERMWMERADYGHFFYRIPNGESAADAYDRVSGFNESLWRLFGEEDMASVCVLVTHGLMTRVFLMKWYHWSVEYFEDLRNINHCEFVIMTHNQDNGKYTLQNKLRTWSDLKKERDAEKERERAAKGLDATPPMLPTDHIPIRRKWGGCPDGCTHGLAGDVKRSLRARVVDSMRHENGLGRKSANETVDSTLPEQPSPLKHTSTQSESQDGTFPFPNTSAPQNTSATSKSRLTADHEEAARERAIRDSSSEARSENNHPRRPNLGMQRDSEDYLLHPPAASSSSTNRLTKLALLHLGGRDGGGSMSGANSLAPSDDEGDDHDHHTSRSATIKSPSVSRLVPPSQDLEDDGDDELSAKDTKRSRAHPHHHHHHHPVYTHTHHRNSSSTSQSLHRMANVLGDGDDMSTRSGALTPELPGTHSDNQQENGTLEAQQHEDQSIRGSVY